MWNLVQKYLEYENIAWKKAKKNKSSFLQLIMKKLILYL